MNTGWSVTAHIAPCILTFIISVGIGIYAWRRRRVPGSLWFSLLMWSQAIWGAGYFFELLAPSLEGKIFWDNFQAVPAFLMPLLFLAFAVKYTGINIPHPRLVWSTLSIVPVVYSLLTIFGPSEWLMHNARLVPELPFGALVYDFPPLIQAEAIYSYGLVAAGGIILVSRAVRYPHYRAQTITVLLGIAIPFIGSVLSLIDVLPGEYRDISPITFSIGSLIVMWGMFRYHLLGVVPASRERVFESIQEAVVVLDDWYIIDFNRAAQSLFDSGNTLTVGQLVTEAFAHWPVLLEHRKTNEEVHTEFTQDVGGENRYFDMTLLPLFGLGGKARLLVVRDITVRKRAELSLRESEERYRRLVENNPAAIAIICDGKVIYTNHSCEMLLGGSADNPVLGKSAMDFILAEEQDTALERITLVQNGNSVLLNKRKFLRLDGRPIYVDVAGIPIEYDGRPAAQFVFWDVTKRIEAEKDLRRYQGNLEALVAQRTAELELANKQLQESAVRVQALLNASPDLICFKDGQNRLIEANAACLAIFGLEITDDYRGKKGPELAIGDARRYRLALGCERKDEIAWRQGTAYRSDEEAIMPDGFKRVYDVIRVPIFSPDGGRQGLVVLGRDITDRAKSEQALKEAEARYRTVADFTYDWEYWVGPDGSMIYVSPSCERITGYPREKFMEDPDFVKKLVLLEDRAILNAHTHKWETKREPQEIRFRIRRKDGGVVWIEHVCRPVIDEDGKFLGYRASNRDITARVKAEEELRRHRDQLEELVAERTRALKESEERFRSIVEQSHDGIVLTDEQAIVIEWAGGSEKIFGLKREEAVGRPLWDIQFQLAQDTTRSPALYDSIRRSIQQAYRYKEAPWFNKVREMRIRRPDGERRIVQTVIFPIETEDKFMLCAIARDVTEQKRAEVELRKLSQAVEQSANTIVITDADGDIEYVNPKFVETTGYTAEEAIGQNPRILKSGEHSEEFYKELWDTITSGGTWKGEFHNKRKDGSLYWERAIISPVYDLDGNIVNFIAIKEDITERKQIERSLRESEALFRSLVSQMPSGVVIVDNDGLIIEWNQAQEEISGIPAEEALGQPFWEVQQRALPTNKPPARLRDNIKRAVQRLTSGEMTQFHRIFGQRIRRPDGTYRYVQVISFPVSTGEKSLASSITVDITARKMAEEALRQRNIELTKLGEVIGVITSTLELDEVLQRIIESTMQMFPNIYNATIQLLNEDGNLEMRAASVNTPRTEQRLVLPPGRGIAGLAMKERRAINVADVTSDPRFVVGQTPPAYRSLISVPLAVHDQYLGTLTITSQTIGAFDEDDERLLQTLAGYAALAVRNAHLYEQTQRDAETKAMLLKEVNHRVKNNLATIIGLLYAEKRHAASTSRGAYRDILGELINRIQGLATVHSMLSASSWEPLRLSDLAMQVIRAPLMVLPPDKNVVVTVTPSPVLVNSKQASSLALVLNELATNVIKYGLGERRTARLTVSISEEETGHLVRCEVRDDGPGYPEDVLTLERHNVGLYLVQTIVTRDLGGELMLKNDNGAVTIIRFPNEPMD